MKSIILRNFSFKSYIHLSFVMGISLGLAMGITLFLLSFITENITLTWGEDEMNGIPAGIASLFAIPFITGIMGIIYGIVGFLPFKLFMKIQKKLHLEADLE